MVSWDFFKGDSMGCFFRDCMGYEWNLASGVIKHGVLETMDH